MMMLEREKMGTIIEDLCNDARSGNLSVENAALILKGLESFNPSTPQVTNKKENDATQKKADAIRELARRFNLPLDFVVDNLDKICEITAWTSRQEFVYP